MPEVDPAASGMAARHSQRLQMPNKKNLLHGLRPVRYVPEQKLVTYERLAIISQGMQPYPRCTAVCIAMLAREYHGFAERL
ncbi:hypothetical protein GCM10011349_46590 [Novosphingobium indicum]|uniref:Transposase n=1 Tax=Novosphingobium indicum TaxID=462949 RepID=A0ABQ2K0E8_9SPHN|nr:hypothetical protein GCM10011349_46590 [Novosphingobium indicum]